MDVKRAISRASWFVLLWLAGVLAVLCLAYIIRLALL